MADGRTPKTLGKDPAARPDLKTVRPSRNQRRLVLRVGPHAPLDAPGLHENGQAPAVRRPQLLVQHQEGIRYKRARGGDQAQLRAVEEGLGRLGELHVEAQDICRQPMGCRPDTDRVRSRRGKAHIIRARRAIAVHVSALPATRIGRPGSRTRPRPYPAESAEAPPEWSRA